MLDISNCSDRLLDMLYESYRETGQIEFEVEEDLDDEEYDNLCQNCGEAEIAEDSYTHCDDCRYF